VAGPIPFLPFTHNQILRAVNLGSLPAWFSMVLLPRWRHTKTITLAVAVAYSLLYATLACVLFSESVLSLDFKALTTAEGVTKVFSDSTAVLAGWAHFIVFDLFTARFFLQDSARVGIPHLAVVPCILGCMFFGPVGLLTYVLVKKIYRTIRDKEGGAVKTYSFLNQSGRLDDGAICSILVVEERRKTARTATHTGVLLLLLLLVVAVFLLFLVSSLSSLLLPSTSLCRKQKVANRTSFYSYTTVGLCTGTQICRLMCRISFHEHCFNI
jgi:flagellar biosynthesis protein FlhB